VGQLALQNGPEEQVVAAVGAGEVRLPSSQLHLKCCVFIRYVIKRLTVILPQT